MPSGSTDYVVIWDVDPGSYNLVVLRAGILGFPIPLWHRITFAAGYVRGGGAPPTLSVRPTMSREERRLYDLTLPVFDHRIEPATLAEAVVGSFWIDERTIARAVTRWRVAYSELVLTLEDSSRRSFKWTPSINRIRQVEQGLADIFGDRYS